ncbi:hypothetical protein CS0771_58410 [Catellatospora sp. IY07-71]|nr:hypothetical protein CS0771_58410 [Catellatospora sp. IY07-71]
MAWPAPDIRTKAIPAPARGSTSRTRSPPDRRAPRAPSSLRGQRPVLLAGCGEAAEIAAGQARLVGSLQHPMVTGNLPAAAAALRELAPTYDRLRAALT